MERPTKIVNCLKCGSQIRLPAEGHIHFLCPNCKNKFEYENGEPYIEQRKENQINSPKTSSMQNALKKKSKKRPYLLFLLLIIFLGLIIYWVIPKRTKTVFDQIDTSDVYQSADSTKATEPFSMDNPIQTTDNINHSVVDSIVEEKLKDFAKDLAKHILEELLDEMTEEAKNGHWEKANEWFERTIAIMKKDGKKGKALMKEYDDKLSQVKNEIISQNPNKNNLPDSKSINETGIEKDKAISKVINSTVYTLTVYYSGTSNKSVTVPPNGVSEVILPKGTYSIVAKVSDPTIGEYYGTRTYRGFLYPLELHIEYGKY